MIGFKRAQISGVSSSLGRESYRNLAKAEDYAPDVTR
jgi:hypothetical protein